MTVSPDNSSQWNHEVGVENVVTVNFTTWEFLVLEVGWYILVEGQRFSIKSEYRPKHIHDTKYTYNLKFYGREHDTQDILFCRLNQGEDDLESVFAYDGTPMEFLNKVVANMNRNSDGVVWKAGETITANRQTINFNGLYCWDALGEIARTFGTEWWMDGEYVNLSKCIRGESVLLGYGQGLKSGLTQNENTNAVKWFTRLIPVGSSKNIDKSKYGYATLQLPGREKYIDINTQYGLKEYREEAAFSEIYPHRVGTISSVRSEAKINENLDEYTVYYVKDTSLSFNPDDYMLPGEVIHMTFNTGALAGKEFEVNWNNGTLEFEIINQYPDEDTQWPGGNLIPSGGDLYVLSNISMPDEYNTAAEKEYQEAVDAYLEEYSLDISIYTGNTDYIYVAKNNVPLSLGQRVRLVSEIYFGSNGRDSRITRVSRKLNNLGEATIECGNTISASWTQKISSNINNVAVTQKSDQQKINKTEKDITSLSGLWELKETDSGEKYLFTPYNILTLLGLTSFSTGKAQKFPSIYDGLPIDNQTLYWEVVTEQVGTDEEGNPVYKTTKVLKAKGGGSGEGGGGGSVDLSELDKRYLAIGGTAEAAKKLSKAVKLWGNDFDGASNINGGMVFSSSLLNSPIFRMPSFMNYDRFRVLFDYDGSSHGAVRIEAGTYEGVAPNGYMYLSAVNNNDLQALHLKAWGTVVYGDIILKASNESDAYNNYPLGGAIKFGNSSYCRIYQSAEDYLSIESYEGIEIWNKSDGYLDYKGGGVRINEGLITYDNGKGYFTLNGDLLVTGGLTTFAKTSTKPSWMINAQSYEDITSTSDAEVYSAKVVTMLKERLDKSETKISNIKDALKNISSSSSLSQVCSALQTIYKNLNE